MSMQNNKTPIDTPFEGFKILLIGDVRVGKTSFLARYTRNIVDKNEPPTIGVDYSTKSVVLKDGSIVKAKIWDTAGSEKYKAITTAKSVGALLFYDITDATTFEHTQDWLSEIQDHTEDDIIIMLIGNKHDLVSGGGSTRAIKENDAIAFAENNGLMYSETSAKTGYNVKESFERLVEAIYERQKQKALEEEENNGEETDDDKMRREHEKTVGRSSRISGNQKKTDNSCCK